MEIKQTENTIYISNPSPELMKFINNWRRLQKINIWKATKKFKNQTKTIHVE